MTCGSCGAELRPKAKFCGSCGAAQAAVAKQATAPSVPATSSAPPGDRRRLYLILSAAAVVIAAVAVLASQSSGPDTTDAFHPRGFDDIRIGMTEDELDQALDGGVVWEQAFPGDEISCAFVTFPDQPAIFGLSFDGQTLGMVETHVSIGEGNINPPRRDQTTVEGVGIDTDRDSVFDTYPDARTEINEYGAEWIVIEGASPTTGYIFEIGAEDTVVGIRVGRDPELGAIEGCA